jgi:hypothetical protein
MMRKEIIIPILILLVLPMAFSDEPQDPRALTDVWYYVPQFHNCLGNYHGLAVVPIEGTCENTWFFLYTNGTSTDMIVQLIPAPNETCYYNNENCISTDYDTNLTFAVHRFSTFLPFGASLGGKQTNHTLDVSSCWNWWNTTDKELRDYQRSLCPTTAFSFTRWEKGCSITPYWATDDLGVNLNPDTYMSFKGYGGKTLNIDENYSPTFQMMFNAIRQFVNISLTLWRILYYIVMIAFILLGLFMVFGVLPMGLRWVIKKITER